MKPIVSWQPLSVGIMGICCWMALACPAMVKAERHALLIGCSIYETNSEWNLPGAANDVAEFERLLTQNLEFLPPRVLAGWPDAVENRPTYANICKAFDQAIEECQQDDQLFILLSGHGSQMPLPASQTDWLSTENPEPDGKDEFFAAADFGGGANFILDNQIGEWLDQLRAKGVHTWIVFDSCFSGTMSRGHGIDVVRYIPPAGAGSSTESGATKQLPVNATSDPRAYDGLFPTPEPTSVGGSLVAFYAAQDFETAAEVVRPLDADKSDPANRHGLLCYHLANSLRDGKSGLTYEDLGRNVVGRMRAEGRSRPTPYFEGDLQREVLGLESWPDTGRLFLQHAEGRLTIPGGRFAGLHVGSTVDVFAPGDQRRTQPIGRLRVIQSTTTLATLAPLAEGREETSLPDNAPCQIVTTDYGGAKVRLVVTSPSPEHSQHANFVRALREFAKDDASCFQLVDDSSDPGWVLALMEGNAVPDAGSDGGRPEVAMPAAILLPVERRGLADGGKMAARAVDELAQVPHVALRASELDLPDDCARQLADELQKVVVWQNLWSLATIYSEPSRSSSKVSLELASSVLAEANSSISPQGSRLAPGDMVRLKVTNNSYRPYWFVVLYMSSRYQIQHIKTDAIRGKQGDTPAVEALREFRVEEESSGCNGFVLIAVTQQEHRHQPNYLFLSQPTLGAPGTRAAVALSPVETPFDRVIKDSLRVPQTRGTGAKSPEEPQISVWFWTTNHAPHKVGD